jgi:hypothetical protein
VSTPEDKARENIDCLLFKADCAVSDQSETKSEPPRRRYSQLPVKKTAALSRETYTAYGNQR